MLLKYISKQHLHIELKYNQIRNRWQNKLNLIALHGLLGSKSNFRFLHDPSLNGIVNETFLLDLRNHGDSPHLPTNTFKELAYDLKNFIETNKLQDLCLIGHSFGGRTIFSFLQEYPQFAEQFIRGVIIVDISPKPQFSLNNLEKLLQKMAKMKMKKRTFKEIQFEVQSQLNDPKTLSFIMQNLELENIERDIGFKYSNKQLDWKWRLGLEGILNCFQQNFQQSFNCNYSGRRAIVICGENSTFVAKHQKEDFKQVFPDIDLSQDIHFIKDADHMVHAQQPQVVLRHIKHFLERISY